MDPDILIRRLEPDLSDVDQFLSLWNAPDVRANMPEGKIADRREIIGFLARMEHRRIESEDRLPNGVWGAFNGDGDLISFLGIKTGLWFSPTEIGYATNSNYRGRGITKYLVSSVLNEIASAGRAFIAHASVAEHNQASIGVLNALGFDYLKTKNEVYSGACWRLAYFSKRIEPPAVFRRGAQPTHTIPKMGL